MIQSKDLELIAALASNHSFIETANQLHITQSALSHQIKALEQRLESPVVIRNSKPLQLTEIGERLKRSADEILPRFRQLNADLALIQTGDAGRLRIAIECHACYQWLMPTLNAYRKQWASIDLDIASGGDRFDMSQGLLERQFEIAITADPQPLPMIEYIPLFDYECIVTVPNDHPLAERGYFFAEDFCNETLISYPVARQKMDIFRLFLTPANIEPMSIRTIEMTVMSIQLVASGRGLFGLPSWAASEYTTPGYVSACRLGKDGVQSTLYAAVHKDNLDRGYIRDFIYLAKDISLEKLTAISAVNL